MPQPHRDSTPKYRKHAPSGRAVVTLYDCQSGERRDFGLGRYGTKASKQAYDQAIAGWLARGRRLTSNGPAPSDISVNECAEEFLAELERKCRKPDGSLTGTPADVKITLG